MNDQIEKAAKASRRKEAKKPEVKAVKANLSLSVDQYRRLFVASAMNRVAASAIVGALIDEHLKEWALPVNLIARADKSHRTNSTLCERESSPAPALQDAA